MSTPKRRWGGFIRHGPRTVAVEDLTLEQTQVLDLLHDLGVVEHDLEERNPEEKKS